MKNFAIKHNFLELDHLTHGFFSADGGFSHEPYKSLNCSFYSGDKKIFVSKNINKIKNFLNLKHLIQIKQVHSNKSIFLEKRNLKHLLQADGIVTKLKNIGLCILTADCSPILFYDYKQTIIGACHAGWRGALNGIIKSTILKMEQIGGHRKNIIAVIGPTIHKNSYEIGKEVASLIFKTDVFKKNNEVLHFLQHNKYLFDLPLFIKEKLLLIGIDKIGDVHLDTYTNENFFSYRRKMHETNSFNNKDSIPKTGRQISIIGLI